MLYRLMYIPNRIRLWVRVIRNYAYDAKRFMRYSMMTNTAADPEHLEAKIIAHCHVIEKGMSLKATRLGYGKEIIRSLLGLLDQYISKHYPSDNTSFISAVSSLQEYVRLHEKNNYDVAELKKKISKFSIPKDTVLGGTVELKREEILKHCRADFYSFSQNRHSIRNFSDEPVDLSLIKKAIQIAQKTPSVCNRQSSRVYIIHDESLKNAVLECQSGNEGFGKLADKILIVTSDLHAFFDIHERNQAFIDGGMFGMSLLYALHYVGLGACTLNWSVEKELDRMMRNIVKIHDSDSIVFLIAVGHMPERIKVAKSDKKSLDNILEVLQ